MMGEVHSGGVGAYFYIKGALGGAHYLDVESKNLGYIEGSPLDTPPTVGNPDNNEKVGEVDIS